MRPRYRHYGPIESKIVPILGFLVIGALGIGALGRDTAIGVILIIVDVFCLICMIRNWMHKG